MILLLGGAPDITRGLAQGLRSTGRNAITDLSTDVASMKMVREAVLRQRPVAVVFAGGLEDPEQCEADPDRAFAVNAEGAIHLAAACLEFGAIPVLLSTAEVFGARGGPWMESDEPSPPSTYARTMIKAEKFLMRADPRAIVLRTGPLLGELLIRERHRLGLSVDEAEDEYISPIAAAQVGVIIDRLLTRGAKGLFHVAGAGEAPSRAELARRIIAGSGGDPSTIKGKSGRELVRRVAWARAPVLLAEKLRPILEEARDSKAPLDDPLLDPLSDWRLLLDNGAAAREENRVMGHRQDVRRVEKPWGHEVIWAVNDRYVGKVLFIKAGERLSLQYHEKKDETIYVMSGKMIFEAGPKDGTRQEIVMNPGDAYRVTPFTTHRMIAIEDTNILEASTPEIDDVVRLEDKYGRAGTKAP